MNHPLRVAFFTDSFGETNGVARTSRSLVAFAAERQYPMLCVHGGSLTRVVRDGSITTLSLERGKLGFRLDHDLRFDLLLWRHRHLVGSVLRQFAPDVLHITGPSDVGQLGAYLAHVGDIPLLASWHTNVHDYAALRVERLARGLPARVRRPLVEAARKHSLRLALDFYRVPRRILAPNPELVDLLSSVTGRPTELMVRGVDTERFRPDGARTANRPIRLGFVGRLSPEKNVRMLVDIERALVAAGRREFVFTIVGDGVERDWLRSRLERAQFAGVLLGDALARAYAAMDVFVFPSESDTFGNVVLEALASGTPVVATRTGGPKFIVRPGETGALASDARGFADAILSIVDDPVRHAAMRRAAREQALGCSWRSVFENVYAAYGRCLATTEVDGAARRSELTPAARLVSSGIRAFQAH